MRSVSIRRPHRRKNSQERMERTVRMNRAKKPQMSLITKEMRLRYLNEMEKKHPGYIYERDKLYMLVYTFTGVRLVYSLLYIMLILFYLSCRAGSACPAGLSVCSAQQYSISGIPCF